MQHAIHFDFEYYTVKYTFAFFFEFCDGYHSAKKIILRFTSPVSEVYDSLAQCPRFTIH